MTIFFVIAVILSILCIKKKTTESNDDVLDKNTCTALKGVLAIFIMLHNLGLDYTNNGPIDLLLSDHSGRVAVSMFFFLSGYGILQSYKKHSNKYLVRLLYKNCVELYLISLGINLLEYFVCFRGQFETKDLLLRIFNLDVFNNFNRMNRHGWYISTIIGMYMIFALVMYLTSLLKSKDSMLYGVIILVITVAVFKLNTYIFDEGGLYTNGLPCFGLGLLYSYFYEICNNFMKKYFIPILIVTFVISAASFIFLWATTAGYLMCIFVTTVLTKVRIDNKITLFLGKISLGIYLFLHFSTLILARINGNVCHWILGNALFIFVLAIILWLIRLGVYALIGKIKNNKLEKEGSC